MNGPTDWDLVWEPNIEDHRLSNYTQLSMHLFSKGSPFITHPEPLTTYCALWTAGGIPKRRGDKLALHASLSDLARHTGDHPRTVKRHLQKLVDMGRVLAVEPPEHANQKPAYLVPSFDRVLSDPGSANPPVPHLPLARIFREGNPAVQLLTGHQLLVYLLLYRLSLPRTPCYREVPVVDTRRYRSLAGEIHKMTGLRIKTIRHSLNTIRESQLIIELDGFWFLLQADVRYQRTDGSTPQWVGVFEEVRKSRQMHRCGASCYEPEVDVEAVWESLKEGLV